MSNQDPLKTRIPSRSLVKLYTTGRGRQVAYMILFFIIKHSPAWAFPIYIGLLIDLLTAPEEGRIRKLIIYTSVMMVLVIQNIPSHVTYVGFLSRICRNVGYQLRIRVCRQLQHLSLLYHNKAGVGRLQSKVIRDIDLIENGPKFFVEAMFSSVLTILVALVTMAVRAPVAVLPALLLIPASVMIRKGFRHRLRQRAQEYRHSMETMSSQVTEMINMIPLTRAHGVEEYELEDTEKAIGSVSRAGVRFDVMSGWFASSGWVTFTLFQTLFLVSMILAAMQGWVTAGDVVMFNTFFGMATHAVLSLLNTVPVLSQVRDGFNSVLEVLDAPDIELNRGRDEVSIVAGQIEFEAVKYTYPEQDRPALDQISLKIEPGEAVCIVGPSGGGKSTFLSLAMGFLRAESGVVRIDGRDVNTLDMRTIRRNIGVVTQQSVFFSGTVRENIAYGREGISDQTIRDALEQANALAFVESLPQGLDTRLGQDGMTLSGGQQQRLAIARAIVRQPRVLVLDEPTSALDAQAEVDFRKALRVAMKDRTTIMVSHSLRHARDMDRIIVIENGQVADDGSHEKLIKGDSFYARSLRMLE